MNLYLERLLALLTDERHPQDFPGRQCRRCLIHTISLLLLGQGLPFIQMLPHRITVTMYHERALTGPLVWLLSRKRNLNDLPFVSINFRKGHSSCFSRRTHILLSEGDALG